MIALPPASFPGEEWTILSADATVEADDALTVPTELLNSCSKSTCCFVTDATQCAAANAPAMYAHAND